MAILDEILDEIGENETHPLADLAEALAMAQASLIPLEGASDHGVSESLYLRDPDGNGVELYRDKPRDQWPRAADGRLAMYTRRLDLDAPTAARLNRLYEAEAGLTQLIRERDLARTAYMNAASQYDSARLQLSIRSTKLQVLDSAARPDRPVAPRVARNTATAALVALTFGAFAVIVFDGLRRRRLPAT